MSLFKFWKQDFQSSIVVFLVALPLCLGIALASNAPLAAGLFAGIIGGIVVGSLSGSSLSVAGPAAGLTVIVVNAIQELGSFQAFTLAVFLSGLIQILFSLFKLGKFGDFFPTSVIKGMLAAIGLLLILKQFPHAIGYDAGFMGDEAFSGKDGSNTFTTFFGAIGALHMGAVLISVISIALMLTWDKLAYKGHKFFKLIPGALVAVVLSVAINQILVSSGSALAILDEHLVTLPFKGGFGEVFAGLSLPDWSFLTNPLVYKVAITIALVGSIESLLSVDAADKIDPKSRKSSKNRELLAQGVGNSLSGFIGALPVTAVIVRTSANITAGAQSKLSAVLHGIWILLCVALIPHILNMIPLAVLASVLLLVGYKLTSLGLIKTMYNKGSNQFIPFAATIIAILLTDLLVGIGIGMVVGFAYIIKSNMTKAIVTVHDDKQYLIRFHKDVSFLQKAHLSEVLEKIPENSDVVIDGKGVFVDTDIVDLLQDYLKRAAGSDRRVHIQKSSTALSPFFRE